ncbi:hypothetical protein KIM372_02080 [Bombiscardovia nodaiensis]|uniref:Glycosyl hydrolase family 65 central catalytic domain-containing protein n=1 Tax=Bombiscardovia nodaiensis TaxID=2932181 RepID=A0ABM8B610_9BIFI|nr:hypothetical protein KIM372_02080 [Bombiscardovia nodaiensis]
MLLMTITLAQASAVLFDLDGVLVPTVELHKRAWKQLFDEVLPPQVPPYTEQDYYTYVDGKPRYEGVDSLLKSRGMHLPRGSSSDASYVRSVCGLGNRKNEYFEQQLEQQGIEPYPDTVDALRHLLAQGLQLAVVSSSRNAEAVLSAAGIREYFRTVVDGGVGAQEHLQGKPAPDTYAYAAHALGCESAQCVVVEDALSGVAAGRAGDFGLVVGVDRGAGRRALLKAGADLVIEDLVELIEDSVRRARFHQMPRLDTSMYPLDPWSFAQKGEPTPESATLFSVSNGNIGIRAAGDPDRSLGSGTFVSGYHDTFTITHPEGAYGYARVGQLIQGVPDACGFTVRADNLPLPQPEETTQKLDFRTGVTTVYSRYRLRDGAMLNMEIGRMACLFDQDLALCTLRLDCREREVQVEVNGRLNDQIPSKPVSSDPRKSAHVDGCGIHEEQLGKAGHFKQGQMRLYRCNNSRLPLLVAVSQRLEQAGQARELGGEPWQFSVKPGAAVTIERYVAYETFPIEPQGLARGLEVSTVGNDVQELVRSGAAALERAQQAGAESLLIQQSSWLDDFWQRADIRVEPGDDGRIQQIIRWELFQLAQVTAQIPNGVGAKGLSGLGYDGHYFWDTEIYVLPFLIYTDPARARQILHYRYTMLPAAYKRAAALNLAGALYPWRTINGEEASAYFPTGTAQYHIDADIAYAVTQYALTSADKDYLASEGIDILVQTARMWLSLGSYRSDGHFHLQCVTGPDEYTALVDDNFYTNQMARFNLQAAYRAVQQLSREDGESFGRVSKRLRLRAAELQEWVDAAEAMAVPYSKEHKVHAQDAQFMSRPEWDFEHCTARPLLRYYHPLAIYGHKVLKQTDVVLALTLLSSWFSAEEKRLDFDYYDPLTTGDSTLSAASQSVIAAEVGHDDLAQHYFMESLFADVCNLHSNTTDGIHLAAAGGVWSTLVCGFGGLRDTGGTKLELSPRLPQGWKSLSYQVQVKGTRIRVRINQQGTDLERLSGPELELCVDGSLRRV